MAHAHTVDLFTLVRSGDAEGLERALGLDGAASSIDDRDDYGDTALMVACRRNLVRCARCLIDAGAALDLKDEVDGSSALGIAAFFNRWEGIVEYLLARGASLSVKNNEGKTPFEIAKEQGHEDVVRLLRLAELMQFFHAAATLSVQLPHLQRRFRQWYYRPGEGGFIAARARFNASKISKDAKSSKKNVSWAVELETVFFVETEYGEVREAARELEALQAMTAAANSGSARRENKKRNSRKKRNKKRMELPDEAAIAARKAEREAIARRQSERQSKGADSRHAASSSSKERSSIGSARFSIAVTVAREDGKRAKRPATLVIRPSEFSWESFMRQLKNKLRFKKTPNFIRIKSMGDGNGSKQQRASSSSSTTRLDHQAKANAQNMDGAAFAAFISTTTAKAMTLTCGRSS